MHTVFAFVVATLVSVPSGAVVTAPQAEHAASNAATPPDDDGVLVPRAFVLQGDGITGARIRILTTPTIDIPGLIRLDGRTVTGPVLRSDDETVTATGGSDRPNVMLPRPGRRIVGVIVGVQQDVLTIAREDGAVLTVPRAAIATLERQVGERSRKRGAALGLLIGGGAGAGVGFLKGRACRSTAFLGCFMEPTASTLGGLVLGGITGTLVGAFSSPHPRWQTVPLTWLSGHGGI